jgi:hypothetical protein
MTKPRRNALIWILLASGIAIWWGFSIGQTANGWVDFRAVYYGTRCLLEHHNPYNVSELEQVYRMEGGERKTETTATLQAVVLYVNLPTAFIFMAPFAMLPWGPAHLIWIAFTAGTLILAAFLMWDIGSRYAPDLSLFLVCILLANCESIFSTGNTAGIVVSLCVIAVWCFIKERFVWVGILCLAASLAIKPHDSGLVWLFFLLAGAQLRKRALQTLLVTAVLGLAAFFWLSYVSPGWLHDWSSNLAAISVRGGINEPGPASLTGHSAAMVVDLQAAISVFCDNARIYDPASYLFCGTLLLLCAARTLRSRVSQERVWFALAAVVPLTMLVTYHRPWDAKLVMLAVPACAILWAKGGVTRWLAFLITTAGFVLTGDVPLAALVIIADKLRVSTTGIFGQMQTVMLNRPASLILLVMSVFYVWVYLRRAPNPAETDPGGTAFTRA